MEVFLHGIVSYFVIMDPVGVALIYTALTGKRSRAYAVRMAFQSIGISVVLILVFGFLGEVFLKLLGISIESFRIAGGLLLFYTAFHMVVKEDFFSHYAKEEETDISVFPLAIPLLSGPGCLTLTVLLFSNAKEVDGGMIGILGAVFGIATISLVLFLAGNSISTLIGKVGNDILKRLLGVVLAALSIQFVVDGIKGLI